MARAMYSIDQYVATVSKKETVWIVFNKAYNEVHLYEIDVSNENWTTRYLEKEETDYKARDEFLKYMESNFPDTKLIEVMDLVSPNQLIYPYLGSIAIDIDTNSEVYKALEKLYDKSKNIVLWHISYEESLECWSDKEKINSF